jgi:hypothetical protein
MVMTQKRLITPIEELRDAGQEKMAEYLHRSIKRSITAIDADLKKTKWVLTPGFLFMIFIITSLLYDHFFLLV